MKKALLASLVVALYAAHQDVWFFHTARPLIFGFLPIGLFYHGCFSIAASILMFLLVRLAWPSHIERTVEDELRREGRQDRDGREEARG